MFMLCNDRAQTIKKNGITIKPSPVAYRVIDVVLSLIKTTVSTDWNIGVSILYTLYFFSDL